MTAKMEEIGQNQNLILLKHEVKNEETGEKETRFVFFTVDDAGNPYFAHLDHPCFGPDIRFHGHSHGIICLTYSYSQNICLYNPLTNELRHLPPSFLLSPDRLVPDFFSTSNGIGFGYDQEGRDFKVVRIVVHAAEHGMFGPATAELYELGKDRWKELENPGQLGFSGGMRVSAFEMFYQGFFYWWSSVSAVDDYDSVLWFDMSKEVFGKILMPDPRDYDKLRSLGVLNGSFVMLNVPIQGHEKSFDVWEMTRDELGSSFSWTKLFTIGPVFGIDYPIVFVGSDQLLMVDEEGQLILYNIRNTQHCKPLPIKGLVNTIEAVPFFVRTSLSLKGGDS